MSATRLTRAVLAVLALSGAAALLIAGIAGAQGQHKTTGNGRTYHAARSGADHTIALTTVARACRLKPAPPSGGGSAVNGHTFRALSGGGRSAGSAGAQKRRRPGAGSATVNGHTVHVLSAGSVCRGATGGTR